MEWQQKDLLFRNFFSIKKSYFDPKLLNHLNLRFCLKIMDLKFEIVKEWIKILYYWFQWSSQFQIRTFLLSLSCVECSRYTFHFFCIFFCLSFPPNIFPISSDKMQLCFLRFSRSLLLKLRSVKIREYDLLNFQQTPYRVSMNSRVDL